MQTQRFPCSPESRRHYFLPEIQRCHGTECVPGGFSLQAGMERAELDELGREGEPAAGETVNSFAICIYAFADH